MFAFIRVPLIAAAVVVLSACASFERKAYTAADKPIKHVVLAVPAEFVPLKFGIDGHPGMMLGIFGVSAALGEAEPLTAQLNEEVKKRGILYQRELVDHIKANLAKAGISSEEVAVKRERDYLLDDYKPLLAGKNADAVLDIFVTMAGYSANHPMIDTQYRPVLRMRAMLVGADKLQPLYADDIAFGHSNPFMPAHEIKSPTDYHFPTMASVMDDRNRAIKGIQVAASEVARVLVGQFTNGVMTTANR